MVLAVLAQRAGVRAIAGDVYVSVAGGLRAVEPGVDLGVAVAVASAAIGVPVRPDVVTCGELGLVGEVRQVRATGRRIGEAARLGFTHAIVPAGTPDLPDAPGITLVRVADLSEALWRLFPGEVEMRRSNTVPDLHVLRHA
jgi:DNA repair protein RadA/Sms